MADVEVNGADMIVDDTTTSTKSPIKALKEDSVKEVVQEEEEEIEETVSDLEKQIIRQIEYYFGDVNLPKDKFLLEQIKLDDGWIPLEVMLKFKRLANMSTDMNVIVTAVKKSKNGLLEISDDKKKIRRNPERILPQQTEERRKEMQLRTVYCKGFPQDSTLDLLLEYFQKYGPIDSVFMRNYKDRNTKETRFKGSVFVLFSTKEKADEFLKLEEVKYDETDILRLWQSDYFEQKREERKTKTKNGDEGKKSDEQPQETRSFPKGTVLGLKGELGKLNQEDIKSTVEEFGVKVAFVSCRSGDEGYVRLQEENSAKEVMEKLEDGKLEINEISLEVRVMEGEEEDTLLKEAMENVLKYRRNLKQNNRGRRGGRGGRGGFHNNRKRKGENVGDGPRAKQQVK